MFRTLLVIPVLLVVLAGCGSGSGKDAAVVAASVLPSPCPTKSTTTLAKTRFVADAALAFGAFHRYVYNPYREGKFSSGADGRTAALVKAAAAGAFALNRLNAARKLTAADPTLCKTVKAPLDALLGTVTGLAGKLKSGGFSSSDIAGAQQRLEELRKKAADSGLKIGDSGLPIPGI